jgi:hypothetical protein
MMTEVNSVMVPGAGPGTEDDERTAELVLTRLADSRLMLAMRPAAKILAIAVAAVLTVLGVWLRTVQAAGWKQVTAVWVIVAALAWVIPALSRLASRKEPRWVRAARAHERSLEDRVPAATLEVVRRCVAGLPGRRWRSAHVYVSRCTEAGTAHFGVCQTAGVFGLNGRLLVVLGEHLAAGPAAVTAAVLGHESRHVAGWRMRLSVMGAVTAVAGWVILGWAVPWPVLLLAAAGLQVALTAVAWAIECSCDLAGARTAGPQAMLDALARLGQVRAAARAARPAWQRYALSTLTWTAGPPRPPLPVRRAVTRALTRLAR